MPATRPRRIVRRTVIVLAVVVLVLVWYIAAWVVTPRLAKLTGNTYLHRLHTSWFFSPIWIYMREGRPGSAALMNLYLSVNARRVGPGKETWVVD